MPDESEPVIYTQDKRQEEQTAIQRGEFMSGAQRRDNEGVTPDPLERVGQQQFDELNRTMEALMADMENHQLRPDPETLVRLQQFMERNAERLRKLSLGEELESPQSSPGALERFVQFAEDFKRETEAKANELRLQEQRYRSGDVTEAEYRAVSDRREHLYGEMQNRIQAEAKGIDPRNEVFMDAERFLREQLAPMIELSPSERLALFWESAEKSLLPFVRAYDEIRTRFELGQASQNDLNAAWEEKRAAYERMRERLFAKRGLSPEEVAELEEKARSVIRPDEPMPIEMNDEHTRPFKVSELRAAAHEPVLVPLMEKEEYEQKIGELMQHVVRWEEITDSLENAGQLTAEVRTELLSELREFPAQLLVLDEKTEHPEQSRERRVLIELLTKLRERLSNEFYVSDKELPQSHADVEIEPIPGDPEGFMVKEKPKTQTVSSLDARAAYRRATAAYAAVQHTLSVDHRRELRAHIAQLTSLVHEAERREHRTVVARATEHAPAIAHAVLASMRVARPARFRVHALPVGSVAPRTPQSTGSFLNALGNAFKLK